MTAMGAVRVITRGMAHQEFDAAIVALWPGATHSILALAMVTSSICFWYLLSSSDCICEVASWSAACGKECR
jgi:hypothetical protein